MNPPLRRFLKCGLLLSTAIIALLATGCSSDQAGHHDGTGPQQRVNLPPLAGKDTFFNGQITAELSVGHGHGFDRKPGTEGDEAGPERKRHGGGGFRMGGGGPHGGGGQHGNGGEDRGETGDMSDRVERQQVSSMRHAANQNPPLMIHLRFTNNGTTKAELLVADFLSPLGNFVVEPEKLSLDPGQTLEVEPMTSRIVGEISGATVTLALRLSGHGEKKNITLSIVPETAPAETK